jgi:hypothetical protein
LPLETGAVDLDSLISDPDLAFQVNPDPIRTAFDFDDQKLKKFIKNCNLLMSNLQEKPSALKREHPTLQKMKLLNFFYVCG